MKYPAVEELRARGIPEEDWEYITDDDDIVAEIRLHRYIHNAKYNFDWDLIHAARRAFSYATGDKYLHYKEEVPREVDPPEDLTGLFPDPEDFIAGIRLIRKVRAVHVDDLDAFNEDGRRRAIRLGFPPESFVLRKEEIDYRTLEEMTAALEPED